MVLAVTGAAVVEPFLQVWDGLYTIIPGVVAAIVLLLLGYIVGAILGHVVAKVLRHTKVVEFTIEKAGLQREMGSWDMPHFFGLIVKWYVFVIFLNPAAQVIRLTSLAEFLSDAALWIPNVILAVVIALAGYVLAEYLAQNIRKIRSKQKSLMASTAKALTLIFVALIVLRQIGIAVSVAENAFLVVLGGIMLGLALGFGLALKDDAKNVIKELRKHL